MSDDRFKETIRDYKLCLDAVRELCFGGRHDYRLQPVFHDADKYELTNYHPKKTQL